MSDFSLNSVYFCFVVKISGIENFLGFLRLAASESVQYFQFDKKGNMFMYPAGSGFSGVPQLVQPGDELFLECKSDKLSQGSEGSVRVENTCSSPELCGSSQSFKASPITSRPFNIPLKEEVLEELGHKNFAPDTMKKVKWAVKMYRDWRNFRNADPGLENIPCDLDEKSTITQNSLTFALSRFITEVKKLDGTDFPGKTLYEILVSIQFHLETMGMYWKLLNDKMFNEVKYTLDNMMKIRTAQGVGVKVKKAEFLSPMDEDYLWSIGFLGDHDPETLLNTMVFIIGKGFALRAGKEHQALRSPPFDSQFQFLHD